MPKAATQHDPPPLPPFVRVAGFVLLAVAVTAAGFLVRKHFGGHLPGCGGQSDCDALDASRWGRVPGVGWPTSFLGFSWFLALLAAWVASRGMPSVAYRRLAWLGACGSLVLVAVMISMRKFCPYCAAAHAANLSFAVLLFFMRKRMSLAAERLSFAPRRAVVAGIAAFLLSTAGLAVAEQQRLAARAAGAEAEATAFVAQAVKKAEQAAKAPPKPVDRWGAAGFTGRNHAGPELASIRIVMFTDYQCPDCKRFEAEVDKILAAHPEVSLSVKHFPMCTDCNKNATRTLHPNACAAARAAEAAHILGGDEAFFKMHRWLFSVNGLFQTDAELDAGIAAAGLEPTSFRAVMTGPEPARRIQADADEAIALGLFFTPMIFINGTELKWSYDAAATITRTVDELVAKKLPPAGASADRPPLAPEKYVADWREQPRLSFAADQPKWIQRIGASSGKPVDIVMFGDYASPYTVEMDTEVRRAVAAAGVAANYTYRHYPVNRECNSTLPVKLAPGIEKPTACRMARAAEAAGKLGGSAGYWQMHAWLLANQSAFTDDAAMAAATTFGIDAAAFKAEMAGTGGTAAIANDCDAAKQVYLKSVPTLYVGSRRVPRPKLEGTDVMKQILETAAAEMR